MAEDQSPQQDENQAAEPEGSSDARTFQVPIATSDELTLKITIEFSRKPSSSTVARLGVGGGILGEKQPGTRRSPLEDD